MGRRPAKISGILLFVVFAFFFASTNLCIHTHDGPDGKIVHSHPWSGKSHSHTDGQFQLINILSADTYDPAPVLDSIDAAVLAIERQAYYERRNSYTSYKIEVHCLRGPPMFI